MAWLEFISVTIEYIEQLDLPVYALDCDNMNINSDPLVAATAILGMGIRDFCEQLSETPNCYILLKTSKLASDPNHYSDIKIIGDYLRKHCTTASIITISPQTPEFFYSALVSLGYLDEVECNRYIRAHPLGKYISEDEIESSVVHNYTGGAPTAIDSYLKLRQHVDIVEIQLTGLRTIKPQLYYPKDLIGIIEDLKNSDPEALELLLVLSAFPMGETVHAVRYIQPDRRLHGKSALTLEDFGLTYQFSIRSDSIGVFESHKIIVVHRLVREYLSDIFLKTQGLTSKYEHIQAAIALYFGNEWRKEKYKLKGNFFSGKPKYNIITTSNSRALLLELLCFSHEDAISDPILVDDSLKLISFYIAQLASNSNHRHVIDLTRDISSILTSYAHRPATQEIRYNYMMALRMRECFSEALSIADEIGTPHSADLSFRLKTEIAYCHLSLKNHPYAKQLSDEVKNSGIKSSTILHAKFIYIKASNLKNKTGKLERLSKESRARGATRLSNHIKSNLLRAIGDLPQRRAQFKLAAEEALADGDGLNYVRNTIEYCEAIMLSGKPLEKSDLSHLEEAYRFNYSQRLKRQFKRTSDILWDDGKKKKNIDQMLDLFYRGSQFFQISNNEDDEKIYLHDLFLVLQTKSSHRLDARLRYVFVRALELEILPFDAIEGSLATLLGEDLKIPEL